MYMGWDADRAPGYEVAEPGWVPPRPPVQHHAVHVGWELPRGGAFPLHIVVYEGYLPILQTGSQKAQRG